MTTPAPLSVSRTRLYIHTLGCPKNDADSRGLARSLAAAGVGVVADPDECTHVLVNTCGFIQDAKEESIAAILDACRVYGGERVFVMGCLVERYREELEAGIPEVAAWFKLGEEPRLAALLGGEAVSSGAADRGASDATGAALSGLLVRSDDRGSSYAYVKISDGCDEPCTFCAIPSIKGPYYSVGTEEIMREVDACVADGAREIILVGQDTAVWRDGELDLADLLTVLARDERILRLRVMYLQPEHVTKKLLHCMAQQPKVCRYLDIPFQHAHAEVLRRMGRWGDGPTYLELIARARKLMPEVAVRSTFIVGFPGETEQQFQTLLDFVDEVGFDHAGGFIYSPEEGTEGALLRPRVSRRVALDRLNHLTALIAARAEDEHGRAVGSRVQVLVDEVRSDVVDLADCESCEEGDKTVAVGRTEGQAPEIDGVTYIEGSLPSHIQPGDVVSMMVTDAVGHDLIGCVDAS